MLNKIKLGIALCILGYKISKRKEEFKYGKNQMVFKYNAKI